MSYPDDIEYPYVDLAELADLPGEIDPDAYAEWCDIVRQCEGGTVTVLPWTAPSVPEEDDE